MLKRKLTALLFFFLTLLFVCCKQYGNLHVLNCVPSGAGVVLKIYNLEKLITQVDKENNLWSNLRGINAAKETNQVIKTLDTIIKSTPSIQGILYNSEVVVSFHKIGEDKISVLGGILLQDKRQADVLALSLKKYSDGKKFKMSTQKYEATTIFCVKNSKGEELIFFAYINKFFVISQSQMLLQASVRDIGNDKKVENAEVLDNLLQKTGTDAISTMIVDYDNLGAILKGGCNPKKISNSFERFAKLAIFDVTLEKNDVLLSGYTVCDETQSDYLKVFDNQKTIGSDFLKYLPSKTVGFSSAGISDMFLFSDSYYSYLKNRDATLDIDRLSNSFNKEYRINLKEDLYSCFSGRITEFTCDYSLAGRSSDSYVLAELANKDKAQKLFLSIVKKYQEKYKLENNKVFKEIRTVSGRKYTVCLNPIKNLFPIFFGDLFSFQSKCFVFYDDKIVFAEDATALTEYINALENGKTLDKNSNFTGFSNYIVRENNIFFYVDITYSFDKVISYLNTSTANDCKNNRNLLSCFRNFALEYGSNSSNLFLTSLALQYSCVVEEDRSVYWIAPIDSTVLIKPQVVKNHSSNEKQVIVQDETNRIYLFDKNGKQVWKKQMGEPIVGEVKQIDYYQNGKLQFLFATENHLHLLDINGNYVEEFPIKFPARLSTEISVFDYANDGNYRIFVPCVDSKLYVYTKEGKFLEAWTPFRTSSPVIVPVKYFNAEGTEYLVFADNLKTYIINRRGELRINVTDNFPKSAYSPYFLEKKAGEYRFVTTNSSGEIIYIRMDGSCRSKKFKHYSASHSFLLSDINSDGKNEYIFADENMIDVFSEDGNALFNCLLDSKISGKLLLFSFSSGKQRLGAVCKNINKIYLWDDKGNICSGFPISGATAFSISQFNSKDNFSLLCGSNDNFLYNYRIK